MDEQNIGIFVKKTFEIVVNVPNMTVSIRYFNVMSLDIYLQRKWFIIKIVKDVSSMSLYMKVHFRNKQKYSKDKISISFLIVLLDPLSIIEKTNWFIFPSSFNPLTPLYISWLAFNLNKHCHANYFNYLLLNRWITQKILTKIRTFFTFALFCIRDKRQVVQHYNRL